MGDSDSNQTSLLTKGSSQWWECIASNGVIDNRNLQPTLLSSLLIAFHKLRVRPYCWRKHTIHETWKSRADTYIEPSQLQTTTIHRTRGTMHATKGETPAQVPTLQSTMESCLQDMLVQQWHKVCRSNRSISDGIEGPLQEMEPIPVTAWMTNNLKLVRPGT